METSHHQPVMTKMIDTKPSHMVRRTDELRISKLAPRNVAPEEVEGHLLRRVDTAPRAEHRPPRAALRGVAARRVLQHNGHGGQGGPKEGEDLGKPGKILVKSWENLGQC